MDGLDSLGIELTDAELSDYDKQCEALAIKYGVSKVHCAVFVDTEHENTRRACFLKEPNFPTKIAVMDKVLSIGEVAGSNELREAITLRDESDPLTYGNTPESDQYKLGVINFCRSIILSRLNVYYKKK